jgi:hypothetical protein
MSPEEIPMIRSLRRISPVDAGTRRSTRPARLGAIALALLAAIAFVSACETPEEAPPPPPAEEVFESPPPSAPIQEESLPPPPAPAPPAALTPPTGTGAIPPGAQTIAPPATPTGAQNGAEGQRRFPLSSPGAAPPGSAPVPPAPSE